MGTSRVCTTSLDLKRYLLTPTLCPKPKTIVLSDNQDACPVPTLDGVHANSSLHVNNDELDVTANMVTTSFNKRRRLPLVKLYSPESINPGDKYFGCSTAKLLYLANSCEASCGSLVKQQVLPVCDMNLKNVKLLRCEELCAEHSMLVRKAKINNWFKGNELNSVEMEGDEQKTFYTSKTAEQNGIPDPPSRRKMGIKKTSKNIPQGQKRKKFADDTSTRSVMGHETHEKGDSSCPAAPLRKKARISNQKKDSNTDHNILTDFATSLNYHDPDHSLITRCETLITKTRICIDTTFINNFNVCERFQKERIVSETKLSPNFNSLQLCELRPNDTTKRPVMGKTAKFASMDSCSLDVLKEIKRKVHIKYGDTKRRRVKTNGILRPVVGCRSKVTKGIVKSSHRSCTTVTGGILKSTHKSCTTVTGGILKSTHKSCTTVTGGILKSAVVSSPSRKCGVLKSTVVSKLAMNDKRAVFRWIGMCKKMLGFKKKLNLMKKNYNCCM